ncbi:hypothetical protein D1872_288190 [compost metagenome]
MLWIILIDRLQYFIRLFDQVFANGSVCLLSIPRAPLRAPQDVHNLVQSLKGMSPQKRILTPWNEDNRQIAISLHPIQLVQWYSVDLLLTAYTKGVSHDDWVIIRITLHKA